MRETETVETAANHESLAAEAVATETVVAEAGAMAADCATVEAPGEGIVAGLAELKQTAGRFIAKGELCEILELHLQWLLSNHDEGKRADLSGSQLQGVDLTGADLRQAVLFKANLGGAELFMAQFQDAQLAQANLAHANLLGAGFHRADLQGTDFQDATGLQLNQLAGADLRGAMLPASLSESAAIEGVRQLSKSAAAMLAAILSVCGLACIRVVTATDAQLIKNSPTLPLLHLGNGLPMMAFFLAAPVLLLGLCIGLHLRLLRLWESVEQLPETFPGGKRLADCGPWTIMALGFGQFEWLRGRRLALPWLELAIASFLAYWIPALTLIAFWARYLTVQDLRGAILDVLLIVFAIGLGTILPAFNARELLRRADLAEPTKSLLASFELRSRAALGLSVGLVLSLLSVGVIHGVPHSRTGGAQSGAHGMETWAADVLWLAHIDPYANLAEQDISTKPPKAGAQDEALNLAEGARLRGRSLRHAQAYRAFLTKADLGESNLESADLSESDLRFADLHRSLLQWAVLNHAQLFHANLEDSDLRGANLFRADLSEANLSSVLLGDAILSEASLKLANLYGADLHSSRLSDANLQGADLRGANLEHAKIADAVLQGSYLSSGRFLEADLRRAHLGGAFLIEADLRQADLRGADLRNATLANADLHGANLEGADLREASGVTVAQICSARIDNETQLDVNLADQVNASCPQR